MVDQAALTVAAYASDNPPAPPGTPPSSPPDPDGPAPVEEPPTGIPVPGGPDPVPVYLRAAGGKRA